jgi:hypothetical protein
LFKSNNNINQTGTLAVAKNDAHSPGYVKGLERALEERTP